MCSPTTSLGIPWASSTPKTRSPPEVLANEDTSARNSFLSPSELPGSSRLYSIVFPSGTALAMSARISSSVMSASCFAIMVSTVAEACPASAELNVIKRQENTGVRKILYEKQGLLLVLEWLPPRRSIPGTPLASLHPGKGGHYVQSHMAGSVRRCYGRI